MTDVEIRTPKTADPARHPDDPLIDDAAGSVERLHEKAEVRRVLAVVVVDVPVEAAGALAFGLDGPLDREESLPARNERRHGPGWSRVMRGESACRQHDGNQSDPDSSGNPRQHLRALLPYS